MLFLLLYCPLQAGILLEVSGIDGSGKTTLVSSLSKELAEKGIKAAVISPLRGNVTVYPFLKKLDAMQGKGNPEIDKRIAKFKSCFFLLSLLEMGQQIETLLAENDIVIADRYLFSFKTYQECFKQDEDKEDLLFRDLPKANLTFLLLLPINVALERIGSRDEKADYESYQFLQQAQGIFIREAQSNPMVIYLNGEDDLAFNVSKIMNMITQQQCD